MGVQVILYVTPPMPDCTSIVSPFPALDRRQIEVSFEGSDKLASDLHANAEAAYTATLQKQRLFSHFEYAAKPWHRTRKVIAKAEHSTYGPTLRYLITSLAGEPQVLYDRLYCALGEMENHIKECQLGLLATRLSRETFAAVHSGCRWPRWRMCCWSGFAP